MLEGALESTLDCGGMCSAVPQWKRELLQRRAARGCLPHPARALPAPPPPPPPPPLPPQPADDDEELRYGPGIVKRLKSRYLSLALRDAPHRRPSVLRRAASLEHLLERSPPPPAPAAPPPPPPPPQPRRDCMKRARSVDALSRLEHSEAREERPRLAPRAPRPPRRASPLLVDAERPPPDVVRSALRMFESAPTRPRARLPGVLRGAARTPPRSTVAATQTTPSLRTRAASPEPAPAPAPAATLDAPDATERGCLAHAGPGPGARYSLECGAAGPQLPALAAANPVLLGRARPPPAPRQVGVIRPMPAQSCPPRAATPPPASPAAPASPQPAPRKASARPPPPSAAVSVVFNFSNRKEVPDYIENDGLVLRASRRDCHKAAGGDAERGAGEAEEDAPAEGGPPSPCDVRFVNDNVLINGRSSLRHDALRPAKLKLQFDDSLTSTHEYPAEWSLLEEAAPAGQLARYQPSKMCLQDPAATFQLGVTRAPAPHAAHNGRGAAAVEEEVPHLKPCGEGEGRAWSDSPHLDLLF